MRLSKDRKQAIATITAALEAGITLFDHADIYGAGQREATFSAIWDEVPGLRDKIVLQSKCGIRPGGDPMPKAPERYDFSYEHIIAAVEGSLKRLKTDYLDILLLHRPDPLVEPEEVARAFDDLLHSGKVRFFGVSNHTPYQIDLLKQCVGHALVANQLEMSITHSTLVDAGVLTNQDDPPVPVRGEGTLDYCRLYNITVQAWSPLDEGYVSGRPLDVDDPRRAEAQRAVAELAQVRGVSEATIAIAWLLRHPAKVQPIIGTTTPDRIRACCEATEIELSREEWYRLFAAGRGAMVP
jgi:predicted oxidoreductase